MKLFTVCECAINPDLLERRIEEGRRRFEHVDFVVVAPEVDVEHPRLHRLLKQRDGTPL